MNQCTKLFVFVCFVVAGVFTAFALADEGHAVDVNDVQDVNDSQEVINFTIDDEKFQKYLDVLNNQDKIIRYLKKVDDNQEVIQNQLTYLYENNDTDKENDKLIKNNTKLKQENRDLLQENQFLSKEYDELYKLYEETVLACDLLRSQNKMLLKHNHMLSDELRKRDSSYTMSQELSNLIIKDGLQKI